MVRITQSNITPSSGGSAKAQAVQTADIGGAISKLGQAGVQIFEQMKKKEDTSQLIQFKSKYNRDMAERETAIKEASLNMTSDGKLLDQEGNPTGQNIDDMLVEMQSTKSKYIQDAQTLGRSNDALNYLGNVRGQDDLKTQLHIEKAKNRLRTKDSVSAVGNNAELFANLISEGSINANVIAEYSNVFDDAVSVLGVDKVNDLKNQYQVKNYKQYMDYVSENGRNPNVERGLASIGGLEEWQVARMDKGIEKAEKIYQKNLAMDIINTPKLVQKAVSDIDSYTKSRMSIVDTISKPLEGRNSGLQDIDPDELYTQSTVAISKASLMEASLQGADYFENLETDGNITDAGLAVRGYLESTADKLIAKGALDKSEKDKFVQDSFNLAKDTRAREISSVDSRDKAAYISMYDEMSNQYAKTGDYRRMSERLSEIYDSENVSDDDRSYITPVFVDNEKKAFKQLRAMDGMTGERMSTEILKRTISFEDKFEDVAIDMINNKTYPAYSIYARKFSGDPNFLQMVAGSEQSRENGYEVLKNTVDGFKKSEFVKSIASEVDRMEIPTIKGNAYVTGANDIIESLAVKYASSRESGAYQDTTKAVEMAVDDFKERVTVVKSGTAGGIILSTKQMMDSKVKSDDLKYFADQPESAIEYIEASKNVDVDMQTMMDLMKNDPDLVNFVGGVEEVYKGKGGRDSAKRRIFDLLDDRITILQAPDDTEAFRLVVQTRRGFVPLPFKNDRGMFKGDVRLNEVPISNAEHRKVKALARSGAAEDNRQIFRLSRIATDARIRGDKATADEIEAQIDLIRGGR